MHSIDQSLFPQENIQKLCGIGPIGPYLQVFIALLREFICCFSICTKSTLKERICAIITTFKDFDCNVSFDNFSKLILSIISLAPARL